MNKYHIRYNTKHADSDLVWRVFENDKEYLVKNIDIRVPCRGESTVENNVVKWNICCEGVMTLVDDVAIIKQV
jgi:hypothetical protein